MSYVTAHFSHWPGSILFLWLLLCYLLGNYLLYVRTWVRCSDIISLSWYRQQCKLSPGLARTNLSIYIPQSWRWRQFFLPKHRCPPTSLCSVTFLSMATKRTMAMRGGRGWMNVLQIKKFRGSTVLFARSICICAVHTAAIATESRIPSLCFVACT
jgi:hypothetical protein